MDPLEGPPTKYPAAGGAVAQASRVITKTRAIALSTPSGTTTGLQTDYLIQAEDGNLVGISAAGPYAADVLGGVLLTVSANSYRPLDGVPVTQLLPVAGQPFLPIVRPMSAGTNLQTTLKSSTTLDAAKPVYLILHFAGSR